MHIWRSLSGWRRIWHQREAGPGFCCRERWCTCGVSIHMWLAATARSYQMGSTSMLIAVGVLYALYSILWLCCMPSKASLWGSDMLMTELRARTAQPKADSIMHIDTPEGAS